MTLVFAVLVPPTLPLVKVDLDTEALDPSTPSTPSTPLPTPPAPPPLEPVSALNSKSANRLQSPVPTPSPSLSRIPAEAEVESDRLLTLAALLAPPVPDPAANAEKYEDREAVLCVLVREFGREGARSVRELPADLDPVRASSADALSISFVVVDLGTVADFTLVGLPLPLPPNPLGLGMLGCMLIIVFRLYSFFVNGSTTPSPANPSLENRGEETVASQLSSTDGVDDPAGDPGVEEVGAR